ncbi:hypothetical protein IOD06_06635 [Psychrobacter sp. N25K4-3-2]|uniref:hypothetical protein n=1 Tax=Psychrobacter sp. N25K4-3-2 TaxID=2785026 RepID=UPI00188DB979|nr:hypothetical protein [Psychrobacter sp. N25K4-3-2]MBF4489565.1 hypothetical protein [Psychrobacter sp. N25K4-3-2]
MNQSYLIFIIMLFALSACSEPSNDNAQDKSALQTQSHINQTNEAAENPNSRTIEQQSNSDVSLEKDNKSSTAVQYNKDNANTLESETILFIKALHTTFNTNIEEQQQINEKLQQASSRADDDVVTQMSMDMFTSQRSQLQSLPLTSDKLISIRDKIVKALDIKIDVSQKSLELRNPKLEDEQEFVSMLQESKKLSNEADNALNLLIQEQGIVF